MKQAIVFFVALLAALAGNRPSDAQVIERRPAVEEPVSPPDSAADRYADVLARPLFSPTRRPAQAALPEAAPAGPVTLTGVVLSPGRKLAVVADGENAPSRRVREGDSLGNGIVRKILRDRIELAMPEGQTVLVRLQSPQAISPRSGNRDSAPTPTTEEARPVRPISGE